MNALDMSLLDDALAGLDRETKHRVADSLACHLHNDGYQLQGNTAENDVEWFARNLYEHRYEHLDCQWRDDRPDTAEKEEWRRIARCVLATLPRFQERVAGRLITLSKVTRDIERSLRPER